MPVKTPLDNTLPANDVDFFLMGKTEITPADARLAVDQQRPFTGHILDLPQGRRPMSSQSKTEVALRALAASLLAGRCSAAARTSTTTAARRSRSAPATRSPPTG